MGFDDLPACEYVSPPLTTVRVSTAFFGETAVLRIIQLIERKSPHPLKIEVATDLVVRKSTGSTRSEI